MQIILFSQINKHENKHENIYYDFLNNFNECDINIIKQN